MDDLNENTVLHVDGFIWGSVDWIDPILEAVYSLIKHRLQEFDHWERCLDYLHKRKPFVQGKTIGDLVDDIITAWEDHEREIRQSSNFLF